MPATLLKLVKRKFPDSGCHSGGLFLAWSGNSVAKDDSSLGSRTRRFQHMVQPWLLRFGRQYHAVDGAHKGTSYRWRSSDAPRILRRLPGFAVPIAG
jgi:hypothetical protein